MSKAETEPNLSMLPDYKNLNHIFYEDILNMRQTNHLHSDHSFQMRGTRIITATITVQARAANVINSTTLGPRVAVELESNVCV